MEIIIEGHKVDTKDIWDITIDCGSRGVYITIKVIDKSNIIIGKKIPYETYVSEYQGYYAPYKKLYQSIKEKWEADKSEIPVFKI